MDVRQRVGLNLKRFRKERGLSQEGFAFECELHRTYVSGVERGVRNPTVLVLEQMAMALQVPTFRLLEEPPKAALPKRAQSGKDPIKPASKTPAKKAPPARGKPSKKTGEQR